MNSLVCQILQKYQEIKHMMKETWIKLVDLESCVHSLKSTKMPLISLPADNEEKSGKNLSNLNSYQQSISKPLPPISELMDQMGYNKKRPSLLTPIHDD